MRLNDEQKAAVAFDDNICVEACPGSGKTRTIVAKLLKCLDDIRDSTRRIACITYTHAAVNEIEFRLHEFCASGDEDYYEVGTIHSFCLSNILYPFYYLLDEFRSGFQIIAPESEKWYSLVLELAENYGLNINQLDLFANIHRKPDHSIFVPAEIPDEAANNLIKYLDEHALVNFSDIVYHSFRLIELAPFISRGLACRFVWMLIDEFQDTSDGQVSILRTIAKHKKTKFFLVGDPNQSIMAFAGAHPSLMKSFPMEIKAKADIRLIGNYRCSQKIVEHSERLIATKPSMRAIGLHKDYPIEPALYHVNNKITGIFDLFLPAVDELNISLGESTVLAPWWLPLFHLGKELRKRGIPVIGPGSRPYRRTRLFASLAESLCAFTEDKSPGLFSSTQRSLFILLLNVTGAPNWQIFSYDGRKYLCYLTSLAQEIRNECNEQAIRWLRNVSVEITKSLIKKEYLQTKNSSVISESVEDMIKDIKRNNIDIMNLSVSDLGLYARPRDCLQLITMHSSKGREFDAVAIIDLHDGRVPHFTWRTQDQYDEARRQLYVAITRARKLLMYFTDSSSSNNRPSPFLFEMGLAKYN